MDFKKLRFETTMRLWRFGDVGKKAARLPGLARLLGPRLWNEKNLDATYLPIGETVDVEPGSVVPYRIIEDLIGRASHRFVLNGCLCRTGNRCTEYPVELGCIFLGDGAAQIDGRHGRPVTVDEALSHVGRARDEGLLPCVIHSSFDASLLDIDYRRMLAVCFCCNCCCTFRTDMRGGPVHYRDRIIRLPGLTMHTVGDCALCEKCARACFLGAIKVTTDGPVFAEFCKGCGRCADACPRRNIRIGFDGSVDTLDLLLKRIGARTDIT